MNFFKTFIAMSFVCLVSRHKKYCNIGVWACMWCAEEDSHDRSIYIGVYVLRCYLLCILSDCVCWCCFVTVYVLKPFSLFISHFDLSKDWALSNFNFCWCPSFCQFFIFQTVCLSCTSGGGRSSCQLFCCIFLFR